MARVAGARPSAEDTVAIGACLAKITHLGWMDAVDGARR